VENTLLLASGRSELTDNQSGQLFGLRNQR